MQENNVVTLITYTFINFIWNFPQFLFFPWAKNFQIYVEMPLPSHLICLLTFSRSPSFSSDSSIFIINIYTLTLTSNRALHWKNFQIEFFSLEKLHLQQKQHFKKYVSRLMKCHYYMKLRQLSWGRRSAKIKIISCRKMPF